jgi:hypothetical protein
MHGLQNLLSLAAAVQVTVAPLVPTAGSVSTALGHNRDGSSAGGSNIRLV